MYSVQMIVDDTIIEPKSLYSLEEVLREYPRVTAHGMGFVVKDSSGNPLSYRELEARHLECLRRVGR